MTKLTENAIEQLAIELLQKQGYQHIHAPDIAPDGKHPERSSYQDVVLEGRLAKAVAKINPTLSAEAQQQALTAIKRAHSPDLLASNEAFHQLLTQGITVSYQQDGNQRGDLALLIDFVHPANNDFVVASQFTVIESNNNKRPDLVLFVNGLPLVVIELKNAAAENATLGSAYQQLQTYQETIPSLFTSNAFMVISDGLEARAGALTADMSRFMRWQSADGKREASNLVSQLETLVEGMLKRETLLDLICHFIVFEKARTENAKTGVATIAMVKKLAAYHQYYAVNRAVESTLRATDCAARAATPVSAIMESPENYGVPGVKSQPKGDRKGGVVWHTQGSGKSLSMVFFTGKIVLALRNPTVVIITDRNDLDDQLFGTFAAATQLLRQEPKQADDRQSLKKLLKVASGGVIFSTIQKFQPAEGNVFDTLSERENIVVIADEAHRTQYGFKAKTIDDKSAQGETVGKKTVYGFAKYMRDALPNATYIGFTGTPIESADKNTPAVFGNYIDVYDVAQAVEDGATVRIFYESRLAKVNLSVEGRQLVANLDRELAQGELTETQQAKAKWTQLEALVGSENRVKNIAKDIVTHFEHRLEVLDGKGMIVAMSRRIATDLYAEIVRLKPEWHHDDLAKGVIKVVMTADSADGPKMAQHHTTKEHRKVLANRMKNPDDALKLVIVRDMWLTGFDVPSLHTLYIDKPIKGHNLMQTIARVNRVYQDKPGGLVVDYLGIASNLQKALSFYADAGGRGDPAIAQEQAINIMLEKREVVAQMLHGFSYAGYFTANTAEKLSLILAAEEHVLGLKNGKKRYINALTALSKAFAIAVPHEEAMAIKEEVAFLQAIKARLAKFDTTGSGRSDEAMETTIRQVIDRALVTEKVIDIFDAAGIKKPNISILSEEFLEELKGMKHKNVALEVLKKLLNDELTSRLKKNWVKSRSLMDMLEHAIRKYHNNALTAAQVIDELIQLSQEIVNLDNQASELGLTDFEYAFYTAVADNKSAMELMQHDELRALAVELTKQVKRNASIDWTIRESTRAKLRVIIKRTLRQFGYPPDMQALATETVLKQAELIADEITAAASG